MKRMALILLAIIFLLSSINILGCGGSSHDNDLFHCGLVPVKLNGICGYVDKSGRMVIETEYDLCQPFSETGLAAVSVDGKFGFINKSGNMVIEPRFSQTHRFTKNGLCVVKEGSNSGSFYINANGKEVHEERYFVALDYTDNGLALVYDYFDYAGGYGFIDKKGNYIIGPISYKHAYSFTEEGLALVVNSRGEYLFIDKNGDEVINIRYESAYPFSNGLARVVSNGKFGYIDTSGRLVIPIEYDSGNDFSDFGLVTVHKDGQTLILNKSGEVVLQPEYKMVSGFAKNGLAYFRDEKGLFGYMDSKGEVVIPAQFENATEFFDDGYAVVVWCGLYGVIDSEGNFVLPPSYSSIGYVR